MISVQKSLSPWPSLVQSAAACTDWDVLDDSHSVRGYIKEFSTFCEVSIDSLGVHVVPSMEEAEALAHSLVCSAVLTF